jgi:hypothetical protein
VTRIVNVLHTVWDYAKLSVHHNTGIKLVGESLASIFNYLAWFEKDHFWATLHGKFDHHCHDDQNEN